MINILSSRILPYIYELKKCLYNLSPKQYEVDYLTWLTNMIGCNRCLFVCHYASANSGLLSVMEFQHVMEKIGNVSIIMELYCDYTDETSAS